MAEVGVTNMDYLPDRVQQAPAREGVPIYSVVSMSTSAITKIIEAVLFKVEMDKWKANLSGNLETFTDLCAKAEDMSLDDLRKKVKSEVVRVGSILSDRIAGDSAMGWGGTLSSLMETHAGYDILLSFYNRLMLGTAVRPRMERLWNSWFVPSTPDSRLAFRMLMHKRLDRKEFNQICLEEGWESKWHDKLYDVNTTHPDIYMAFSMYKRNLIKEDKLKEAFSINGWDSAWYDNLIKALHRVPTLRELTTISDFVALPDLYVRQTLRAGGYTEGDIAYLASALAMRPLREEVRNVVGRFLWEHQIGRRTRDSLEENLKKLDLKPKELELNLLWADLRYQDELLDEKLAIIEARVDAGDPALQTQDAIKTAITDLNVLEEKANLMAELWYYKYVYTPP